MSGAKRLLELQEEQHARASGLAIRAGVITRCEFHEDILLRGEEDVTSAYKLGNYLRERDPDLREVFPTSRSMTDAIKAVDDEIALSDCPRCDKLLERD